MNDLYLGIDTSNYTTSIAIVDQYGEIIEDIRRPLEVERGSKGLRQQEALFQHIKNLPLLIEELSTDLSHIRAIGVSTRPRNVQGSYMPVFLAGENAGRILSRSLNVPMRRFSHQEGHIGTCLLGSLDDESFLSIHLSGGTTELVHTLNNRDNLMTKVVGGSLDISMGQLIDRIGVHLGLDFPCGRELDRMSEGGKPIDRRIRSNMNDGWVNLSGYENLFTMLLDEKGHSREDIIYTLFHQLGEIIVDLIKHAKGRNLVNKVYLVGGVSANTIIRRRLAHEEIDVEIGFPRMDLSTDNAVGVAYLAAWKKGWEE
jgi:N6-L-threonylcarbamoyladenine synthase